MKINTVVNILLFYLGWFAAILGAANGYAFLGPIVILLATIIHIIFFTEDKLSEIKFIVLASMIGPLIDCINPNLGYVTFSAPQPSILNYPIWMISLWAGFATTFSISLKWIQGRYLIGFIFGAVGGPISFLAGERMNALSLLGDKTMPLVVNGVSWGIVLPVLIWLYGRVFKSRNKSKE